MGLCCGRLFGLKILNIIVFLVLNASEMYKEEIVEIQYLGHSCFKIKGKKASLIIDPYNNNVGFELKKQSADMILVSHDHDDHNAIASVGGTARREVPYVISAPGEYEVEGVGVFGWSSYHDDEGGASRGSNTIYVVHIDGIRVVHLGDLGHLLTESLNKNIGEVDVVLIPVGGHFTIGAKEAVQVIKQLSPSIVIPMHFKTEKHDSNVFEKLASLKECLDVLGVDDAIAHEDKLTLLPGQLPEELEFHLLSS